MARTYKTILSIGGKVDKSLKNALGAAEKATKAAGTKMSSGFKKAAKAAGISLVVGITAATVAVGGLGIAAVKNAKTLQAEMQNVTTLLDGTATEVAARTSELSGDVIKVSNATGIATSDLSSGLYDVISAVGDSEDAISILETSAKAAAAGNASTSEAVSLLTAVTKGYGDTSGEAFQKASDLAFQTAKLGQTTFPELAASIGKVTPLAATLGVEQEELFGVFATLTGVTGGAAEVATQYKAVLSGLMSPTDAMAEKLGEMGYKTGSAAIESLGFQGTLDALKASYAGNNEEMAKSFSSVEAQTAVLALCGTQTDALRDKTQAMYEAEGIAAGAFDTKTQSVEYMSQRIKTLGDNFLTSIGTKILPYLAKFAEEALPKVEVALDKIIPIAGRVWDAMVTGATTAYDYFTANIQPVLKDIGENVIPKIQTAFETAKPIISDLIDLGVDGFGKAKDTLTNLYDGACKVFDYLKEHKTTFSLIAIGVGTLTTAIVAYNIAQNTGAIATGVLTTAMLVYQGVTAICTTASAVFGAVLAFITSPITLIIIGIGLLVAAGVALYQNWDTVCVVAGNLWEKFKNLCGYLAAGAAEAWNNFVGIIQNTVAFQNIMTIVDTVKTVFSNLIEFIQNVFTGNWQGAWQNIVNIFSSVFNGVKSVCTNILQGCVSPINAIIRGVNKVRSAMGSEPIPEISFTPFANGGTVTSPTFAVVGEGKYAETIIPHNNSPRSRALLDTATKGVYGTNRGNTSNKNINITYAPVITGGSGVAQELKEDFERFKEYLSRYNDENNREVFA